MLSQSITPDNVLDYLIQVITEHPWPGKQCLLLPSITTLSQVLRVSPEMINQALRLLKQAGFDNVAGGLYGEISLWSKSDWSIQLSSFDFKAHRPL